MRGSRIEKEVEICATNLANKKPSAQISTAFSILLPCMSVLSQFLLYIVISRRISLVSGD
jgi:hypothetical protein